MSDVSIFDGRTRLTFAEPIGSGSVVDYLTVRVEGPELLAGRQVYAGWIDGFANLASWFEGLAESWRGWNGEQAFESIEHDLRLSATHDGHVRMAIDLWESSEPRGWRVKAELRIDPGEQLSLAANELSALLRR